MNRIPATGRNSVTTRNLLNEGYVSDSMTTSPSGTLKSLATLVAGQHVRLNPASNFTHGEVEYTAPGAVNFDCTFDFWAGGGTGADAFWLYVFTSNTPDTEEINGDVFGFGVAFSEFSNQIQIRQNGTDLYHVTQNNIGNSTWHSGRVTLTGRTVTVYYEGSLVLTYTLPTLAYSTKWGVGGRSGGQNNEHRIRNLTMRFYARREA